MSFSWSLLHPIGFIKSEDSKKGPFFIFCLAIKKIFSKRGKIIDEFKIDEKNKTNKEEKKVVKKTTKK